MSIQKLIDSVRIYSDWDAFKEDGKRIPGGYLASRHDALYQSAIDLKLATHLAFLEPRQRKARVRELCEVATRKAGWWPANTAGGRRRDYLVSKIVPPAESNLGKTWLEIRLRVEPPAPRLGLWDEDPSLFWSPQPGAYLCRAACIGHEGYFHYFVYGNGEARWENALQQRGLEQSGSGAKAYRDLLPEPGAIAGE